MLRICLHGGDTLFKNEKLKIEVNGESIEISPLSLKTVLEIAGDKKRKEDMTDYIIPILEESLPDVEDVTDIPFHTAVKLMNAIVDANKDVDITPSTD